MIRCEAIRSIKLPNVSIKLPNVLRPYHQAGVDIREREAARVYLSAILDAGDNAIMITPALCASFVSATGLVQSLPPMVSSLVS